jgi:hypothetical protein
MIIKKYSKYIIEKYVTFSTFDQNVRISFATNEATFLSLCSSSFSAFAAAAALSWKCFRTILPHCKMVNLNGNETLQYASLFSLPFLPNFSSIYVPEQSLPRAKPFLLKGNPNVISLGVALLLSVAVFLTIVPLVEVLLFFAQHGPPGKISIRELNK